MSSEFWTYLSGLLVSISGTYYAVLVFLRKAPGNPASWLAWSIIGMAMFVTSDASVGFNAITFNVTNPTVITIIGLWRQFAQTKMPTRREMIGGTLGLVAIAAWLLTMKLQAPAGWTLGLSILADLVPLWLVIEGAWENPQDDKPFAWALFAFGFGLGAFGLTEFSLFTLALPVYMFIGPNVVALPLVMYRIRHQTPLREWL
jgi:hypothetical protein